MDDAFISVDHAKNVKGFEGIHLSNAKPKTYTSDSLGFDDKLRIFKQTLVPIRPMGRSPSCQIDLSNYSSKRVKASFLIQGLPPEISNEISKFATTSFVKENLDQFILEPLRSTQRANLTESDRETIEANPRYLAERLPKDAELEAYAALIEGASVMEGQERRAAATILVKALAHLPKHAMPEAHRMMRDFVEGLPPDGRRPNGRMDRGKNKATIALIEAIEHLPEHARLEAHQKMRGSMNKFISEPDEQYEKKTLVCALIKSLKHLPDHNRPMEHQKMQGFLNDFRRIGPGGFSELGPMHDYIEMIEHLPEHAKPEAHQRMRDFVAQIPLAAPNNPNPNPREGLARSAGIRSLAYVLPSDKEGRFAYEALVKMNGALTAKASCEGIISLYLCVPAGLKTETHAKLRIQASQNPWRGYKIPSFIFLASNLPPGDERRAHADLCERVPNDLLDNAQLKDTLENTRPV